VSCKTISIAEEDKTIPVRPPTVNKKRNPKVHKIGTVSEIVVPYIPPSQLNTLIPVGKAITIVAPLK